MLLNLHTILGDCIVNFNRFRIRVFSLCFSEWILHDRSISVSWFICSHWAKYYKIKKCQNYKTSFVYIYDSIYSILYDYRRTCENKHCLGTREWVIWRLREYDIKLFCLSTINTVQQIFGMGIGFKWEQISCFSNVAIFMNIWHSHCGVGVDALGIPCICVVVQHGIVILRVRIKNVIGSFVYCKVKAVYSMHWH